MEYGTHPKGECQVSRPNCIIVLVLLFYAVNVSNQFISQSSEIVDALTNLGEAYLRLGYTGKAGLAFARARVMFDNNELPASESRRSKARVMSGLAYCSYLAALRNTQKR